MSSSSNLSGSVLGIEGEEKRGEEKRSMSESLGTLVASLFCVLFGGIMVLLLSIFLMEVFVWCLMLFFTVVILIGLFFFPRLVLTMLCVAVFFWFLQSFFSKDDDYEDLLSKDSYDSTAAFNVATRIEKICGGKVYVGLRIPDPDTKSRQNIDMVLVMKDRVMVVSVWNFTGSVDIDGDGSWVGIGEQPHKTERHPSPVEETKRQVAILESYLKRRGVILPEGHLIGRVVLPDPNCRVTDGIDCLPEVISFNKWSHFKPEQHFKPELHFKKQNPEPKTGFLNWFKDAFRGGKNDTQNGMHQKNNMQEGMHQKNDTQEGMHQQLCFILSTAPMWDRLELKGDRKILGEFMKFKGKWEDMNALGNVERLQMSQLVIRESSLFGDDDGLKIQVLCAPRDYRREAASASEQMKATVKSSTEVVFKPLNSEKMGKIQLSSVVSVSLSA